MGETFQQQAWIKEFGGFERPKAPWRYVKSGGCQLGLTGPSTEDSPGLPVKKTRIWVSDYDIPVIDLSCRNPLALLSSGHKHAEIRGRVKDDLGKYVIVAGYTEPYGPVLGTVYAHGLTRHLATLSSFRRGKK